MPEVEAVIIGSHEIGIINVGWHFAIIHHYPDPKNPGKYKTKWWRIL
jgi:hypothetical protein